MAPLNHDAVLVSGVWFPDLNARGEGEILVGDLLALINVSAEPDIDNGQRTAAVV